MVTRALLLLLGALATACGSPRRPEPEALVLRGFRVVDPASRSVVERDVVVQDGVIVGQASAPRVRVVEGRGRWLMPALWDLKASLWGNESTLHYSVLAQGMSFTKSLGVHLYYGVASVGVFAMERSWVERELKRADALQLIGARALYPDEPLCGAEQDGCAAVPDAAAASAALERRLEHGAPFVYIRARATEAQPDDPGVSDEVLSAALSGAKQRGLPSVVLVDDWTRAAQAVELGASVVYGLPDGSVSDELIERMRARQVAFAPALGFWLELDRVLGNERVLEDPFLTATLQPQVRDSYRGERGMHALWQGTLLRGRSRRDSALASLRRIARGGVRIVAASDAGWSGAFQGHASHALQGWFERVEMDGWSRVSAATLWPAQALGGRVGFEPGDPADFLVLDANPLESAHNLSRISLVIRGGTMVDRQALLPDLTRGKYRQR